MLPGAKVIVCYAHLTGIAWQKRSFRDQFLNQEYYQKFHELLSRATSCPTPEVARVVQAALIAQLREWNENKAAAWFEKYWCGKRSTWTIGDAGVGQAAHNNGVESTWPKFTQAVWVCR